MLKKIKEIFSRENMKKFFYSFIWIAVLVFVVDIITKWVVQNNVIEGQFIDVIPNFCHITLSHNLGASFGIGSNGEIGWRIFWIFVSIILSGVLVFVFSKYFRKFNNIQKTALALMIGGAFGNMIDRCFYWKAIVDFDGVIDWIDFQFGSYHFATFNIADSALVIGVAILIVIELIDIIKETREKSKNGEYDIAPNELNKKEDGKNQN